MSKLKNGPRRKDPEFDVRHLRREILLYCHGLPELIRSDAGCNELAYMAITLGKCFCWLDGTFQHYDRPIWTMDSNMHMTVGGLGKKLWELGLQILEQRGHESAMELQMARLNLRLHSLEQIVLRTGGPV